MTTPFKQIPRALLVTKLCLVTHRSWKLCFPARISPRAASPFRTFRKILLPFCLLAPFSLSAADKTPKPGNLVVPGKSIGDIKLGEDESAAQHTLGKPDYSDAAMGKVVESWWLGEKRGDKGRMFHRPDEIGLRAHLDDDGSRRVISQVEITSPKFATAEGIAPGSALDAIRAKFPDIQPDNSSDVKFWPLYGEMEFFKDAKRGIAFAVSKGDGVCVQVSVMQPESDDFFLWFYPMPAQDYVIDDVDSTVGGIKLGMSDAKLLALLGKPDEKRDSGAGTLWRWRVPAQKKMEVPALCVYLRKLPGGILIAEQIRVSSPDFMLTDKIFPGCPLKEALAATPHVAKLDSYDDERVDIYGDLRAGILFEVRETDSICTAISIFPPPLAVQGSMGGRWLDLPPAPSHDD